MGGDSQAEEKRTSALHSAPPGSIRARHSCTTDTPQFRQVSSPVSPTKEEQSQAVHCTKPRGDELTLLHLSMEAAATLLHTAAFRNTDHRVLHHSGAKRCVFIHNQKTEANFPKNAHSSHRKAPRHQRHHNPELLRDINPKLRHSWSWLTPSTGPGRQGMVRGVKATEATFAWILEVNITLCDGQFE
ncbi:hypothetical protein O3P69_016856 [Scylla paramamosain]|uniref:Uncharacterized protein n=1 Tax=Scylla paramamosain TaxID=85552 RepID=A0AAW0SZG4_SCYPA